MSFSKIFIAFTGIIAVASSNPLVPRASTACSTSSGPGFCQSTSSSCSGGKYIAGACPGGVDNQCCVATCSSGTGACQATSVACSGGSFSAGLCPGPADVQVRFSAPLILHMLTGNSVVLKVAAAPLHHHLPLPAQ